MNYSFETINDKELEELAKDLLENELKISLQNFKRGKDKGIDLRYSTDVENKIVVQVKHYAKSKFSNLISDLKRKEKPKIDKLSPLPERYILFTSLPLNPDEVDEIKRVLHPYVISTNDVYGRDRVNSLLRKKGNKYIEEKYFKLWLPSVNILNRILHNAINGRSEFYKEKIIRNISLFVPNQTYNNAKDALLKNKFLIITGEPGVGKTTLAYMLVYQLLDKGYKLISVDDKIKEAEALFSNDPKQKQIIYFDDFLGSNILEIINPRNTESSIVDFVERVISTPNKLLIFTSRTTIINQAEHNFEKLKRASFGKISKYEVLLGDYSKLDKAKILYNHIMHSNLEIEYIDIIFIDKNYLRIINHKNYTPRLIEFITRPVNFSRVEPCKYMEFIMKNLDNPEEIWGSAYEVQLDDEERFLLMALFTLGDNVTMDCLEKAFNKRVEYEIKNKGYKLKNDAFNISIKKLSDSFIRISKDLETGIVTFNFINPSVVDFLFNYLKTRPNEKWRVVYSVYYIEQLVRRFHPSRKDYIGFSKEENGELFLFLKKNIKHLKYYREGRGSKEVEQLSLLREYFSIWTHNWADLFHEITIEIDIEEISSYQLDRIIAILSIISEDPEYQKSIDYIKSRWTEIIHRLFDITYNEDDFGNIRELFDHYDISFEEYKEDEANNKNILDNLEFYWANKVEEFLSEYDNFESALAPYYEGEMKHAEYRIQDKISDFISDAFSTMESLGISTLNSLNDLERTDTQSFLESVVEWHSGEAPDSISDYTHTSSSSESEEAQIHRLFER